jgi:hypothetical protein
VISFLWAVRSCSRILPLTVGMFTVPPHQNLTKSLSIASPFLAPWWSRENKGNLFREKA